MTTLSELINQVCDDLNRDDLTAQCSDAVVMAIRHFDRKRWWFAEGSQTFTTTASVSVYPLASNFRSMDYAEAQWPGENWHELRPRTLAEIKLMNQGQTTTGYPSDFAIYDQAMHLAYTPGGAYVVRYYYQKSLSDLTANGSNEWTTDCKDLVRAHAARTVAMRTLHDMELASAMATIESEEMTRLLDENDRRTSTGFARPRY